MMTYSIIQKSQLEGALRLDAEYYKPEYLDLEKKLNQVKSQRWSTINGKFITGPFGSEFNVGNYIKDGQCRYIRGKDVKDFFLLGNDNVYIPEDDFSRLKKYSLIEGDILISVVGTIGNVSIVDKTTIPAIFSCKSTVFRTDSIDPFYFIAYLNSNYGKKLLLRSGRGHVQTGLNIEDLKSLLIFVPEKGSQKIIGSLVLDAKQELENSKKFYQQAEVLLLEELGLTNFESEQKLFSIVNLSEAQKANRIDSEYYQPKFKQLIQKIKKYKSRNLSEIIENVLAQFNPHSEPDKKFQYVELSNIDSSLGIIDGMSDTLGREAPSRAKRTLKSNDVIISSIEGSLEKVALASQSENGFLASTGFFQFRSKEILPEVLLVLSKSIVMQYQLLRRCAGTILTAVPQDSIKDIGIPILSKPTQRKIADLVRKSHTARQKSKELLEGAKRKVEEIIEKGGE